MIYAGQGKRIFRASLIQISVIYTHAELAVGLWDDDWICQPVRVEDLSDKFGVKELADLLPDELLALRRLPPDLLLHRAGVRAHRQVMLDHLPRDPGHIGRLPCKHVDVSPEEGDKRAFLFAAQVTADSDDLGGRLRPPRPPS